MDNNISVLVIQPPQGANQLYYKSNTNNCYKIKFCCVYNIKNILGWKINTNKKDQDLAHLAYTSKI